MKKVTFLVCIFIFSFILRANNSNLIGINFYQKGEVSYLEMLFDSNNVEGFRKYIRDDKQVILDLKNVNSVDKVLRGFDASEFEGSVVFVSPYQKKEDIRIAIQLRDNVRTVLKRRQNRLVLEIENRFGAFDLVKVEENKKFESRLNTEETTSKKLHVPRSASITDILSNITLSGAKKYIGKKVTIDVKNVPVTDVLKMISEVSGFNIILTEDVQKLESVTLTLNNIPWDQALDTILSLNNLVAKKNGEILIVQSLKKVAEQQKLQALTKKETIQREPLVTKIFPLSFAETKDLLKIIKPYTTDKRGRISVDPRTNSLIVKDSPKVVERIRKIIEVLDTQTPQILIQSKIIELNESYNKSIGFRNGVNFHYNPFVRPTSGPGEVGKSGFTFSPAETGDQANGFLKFGILNFGRLSRLDFSFELMESRSKAKIVASPKIITQNKKKAVISSTDSKSFSVVTVSENNKETRDYKESKATLSLEVLPQVTNEGSISMEISIKNEHFARDQSETPQKKERNISTNVLVDNGSTIVIGGLYNSSKNENFTGVPFLRKIPILGWLFRTPYNPSTSKDELVIFLTPSIINQKESGLKSFQSI